MVSAQGDLLDSIIYAVIVLFILSVIVEKFTALYRRYPIQIQVIQSFVLVSLSIASFCSFCQSGIGIHQIFLYLIILIFSLFLVSVTLVSILDGLYNRQDKSLEIFATKVRNGLDQIKSNRFLKILFWANPFKHTAKKELNNGGQVTKDKELTALSFLLGVLVAFLFDLPIFSLFKQGELSFDFPEILNENLRLRTDLEFDLEKFIGILLTGFFLSFGSKFFHDLLERLYYVKKAKQGLAKKEELLSKEYADEILEFIEEQEFEEVYEDTVMNYSNLNGIKGFALDSIDGKSTLVIKTNSSLKRADVQKISQVRRGGKLKEIPYKLVDVSNEQIPRLTTIPLNTGVYNFSEHAENPDNQGQILWPIEYYGDSGYYMTCYHVAKHPNQKWKRFIASNSLNQMGIEVTDERGRQTGKVVFGSRTHRVEFAVVKIGENNTIDIPSDLKSLIKHNKPRKLTKEDKGNKVFMFSRKLNKIVEGIIQYPINSDYFPLPYEHLMFNLILITNLDGTGHLQEEGDSGSILIHEDGHPIGMVFARTYGKWTHAMSLFEISKEIDFKLII